MELVTADSRPVRTVFSGCLKDNLPEVKGLRRGRYAVLSPMLRDPVFYDLQDDPAARRPLAAAAVPDSAAMLEALRGFTLRGLNGEVVFWYRSAEPIDRLRLSVRHAHAPLAVFPYDGLAWQQLHCGPQETNARFQHEPDTGPTQVVFALVAPEPMTLEVRLQVNGQPVPPSQWRIGVNGSAPDGTFSSDSTVVPLHALGLLRLPDAGELCVFTVESLTSKMGGGQTGSNIVDEAQRAALRALGYIGDEQEE